MKNKYAVTAAAGYYSNGVRTGGHMVVICATQFIDNSSGSTYYIDYIDPSDGKRYHMQYSDFCNGTTTGRIYDGSVYII